MISLVRFWEIFPPLVEVSGWFFNSNKDDDYPAWTCATWVCHRPGNLPLRLKRAKTPNAPTRLIGFENGDIFLDIPYEQLKSLPWEGEARCPDTGFGFLTTPARLEPTLADSPEKANTLTLTIFGEKFVFKRRLTVRRVVCQWLVSLL
jgi:hypothetical protein